MTASLLIEEESGTYSGRIRHSHNGCYAGDFSQTPRSATELRASYAGRREVPRAEAQYGARALAASVAIPDRAEHRRQPAVSSRRDLWSRRCFVRSDTADWIARSWNTPEGYFVPRGNASGIPP